MLVWFCFLLICVCFGCFCGFDSSLVLFVGCGLASVWVFGVLATVWFVVIWYVVMVYLCLVVVGLLYYVLLFCVSVGFTLGMCC